MKAAPKLPLAMGSTIRTPSIRDALRFLFDGLEVRAIDREGRPWFVGSDVCGVLGHGNHKQALSRLPATERSAIKIPDALGRDQSTTIISLAGVFRLALTSRVEGAEKFQAWLTDEVLPRWYAKDVAPPPRQILTSSKARVEAELVALQARLAEQAQAFDLLRAEVAALARAPAPAALPAPRPRHTLPDGRHSLGASGWMLVRGGAPVLVESTPAGAAAIDAAWPSSETGKHYALSPWRQVSSGSLVATVTPRGAADLSALTAQIEALRAELAPRLAAPTEQEVVLARHRETGEIRRFRLHEHAPGVWWLNAYDRRSSLTFGSAYWEVLGPGPGGPSKPCPECRKAIPISAHACASHGGRPN